MGVYDTITFECPNCKKVHYAQSKSGPCKLAGYTIDAVPISVAQDANRHAPYLCSCGKSWEFTNIPDNNMTLIPLKLKEV